MGLRLLPPAVPAKVAAATGGLYEQEAPQQSLLRRFGAMATEDVKPTPLPPGCSSTVRQPRAKVTATIRREEIFSALWQRRKQHRQQPSKFRR